MRCAMSVSIAEIVRPDDPPRAPNIEGRHLRLADGARRVASRSLADLEARSPGDPASSACAVSSNGETAPGSCAKARRNDADWRWPSKGFATLRRTARAATRADRRLARPANLPASLDLPRRVQNNFVHPAKGPGVCLDPADRRDAGRADAFGRRRVRAAAERLLRRSGCWGGAVSMATTNGRSARHETIRTPAGAPSCILPNSVSAARRSAISIGR